VIAKMMVAMVAETVAAQETVTHEIGVAMEIAEAEVHETTGDEEIAAIMRVVVHGIGAGAETAADLGGVFQTGSLTPAIGRVAGVFRTAGVIVET